jgi:hypothetical protein
VAWALVRDTEDSVFQMHAVAEPAVGREPVRELIALLTLTPNIAFEPNRIYLGTDHLVFEYAMSGTFDGTDFVCDGVDVNVVSDGLVARTDTYLDLTALVSQVGPLPELAAVS